MKKRSNKGFTLIEVIIAISIFTVVIGIGYAVLNKTTSTVKEQQMITEEQLNANLINKYLVKDLEICRKFTSSSNRKFVINEDEDAIEYEVEVFFDKGKEYYNLIRTSGDSSIELVTKQPKISSKPFFIEPKHADKNIYTVSIDSNGNSSKKYVFDVSSRLVSHNEISIPEDKFEESNKISFWANDTDTGEVQIGYLTNGQHGLESEYGNVKNDSKIYHISGELSITNTGALDTLDIGTGSNGSGIHLNNTKVQTTIIKNGVDKMIVDVTKGGKLRLTVKGREKPNGVDILVFDNNEDSKQPFIENSKEIPIQSGIKYLTITGWFEKNEPKVGVNITYGKAKQ